MSLLTSDPQPRRRPRGQWRRVAATATPLLAMALAAGVWSGAAAPAAAAGTAPSGAAAPPGSDGKIVFVRDGDIFAMNPDGSQQTRISPATSPVVFFNPDWSPDGSRIVAGGTAAGNHDIYVMTSDGSGLTRLTSLPSEETSPSWSPDGRKIAFSSDLNTFDNQLWVMNADGSGQVRLQTNVDFASEPDWSPDGTMIAYTGYTGGFGQFIYAINADGTGVRKISTGGNTSPNWSPDGSRIAYSGGFGGMGELVMRNADGTGPEIRITNTPQLSEGGPTWSPDGTRIATTGTADFEEYDVYVMGVDGSGQTRLTTDGRANAAPAWRPAIGLRPQYAKAALYFTAQPGSATVTCPTGTVPISAGGFVGEAFGEVRVTAVTVNTTRGVTVTAAPDQGFTGKYQVNAIAVCAPAPRGYQLVHSSSTAAPGRARTTDVSCPTGKVALGGGTQVTGGVGDVGIDIAGVPRAATTGPPSTVTGGAAIDRDGFTGAWALQVTAVCADPLPGLHVLVQASPVNSASKALHAICPTGEELLGVSGEILPGPTGRTGDLVLDDTSPHLDLGSGTVTGVEDPEIVNAPVTWGLQAHTTCLPR